MTINVTLPVFNEAAQLAGSVRRLTEFLAGLAPARWEIVLAENGSTDGTRALAEELASESEAKYQIPETGYRMPEAGSPRPERTIRVRVVHLDQAGRGGALRAAWLGSAADLLSYMDVDLSTDLACLPALLAPLLAGTADLAIGSRLLPGSRTTRGWKREVLSRGYNVLLRSALGLRVRDAQCGFKALTRQAARALLPRVKDEGWFFDTELLFRAQREGWRIAEVPVRWVDDPGSTVRLLPTIWRDLRGVGRLWRGR
jgi:glycosyltransferase involved in cell wall biosynthesis